MADLYKRRRLVHREYGKWWSPNLQREMEFLWYGYSGRAVLLFPTSMGRCTQNEDFGLTASLSDKVDRGEIQLICVDSVDEESWYNDWAHPSGRARRHDQYDSYLLNEILPYVQHRSWRQDMAVFGASFGAYHAANFAARHPEAVSTAICFSGLYDIHRFTAGYWDDNCYYNCPTAFIPNLDHSWVERLSRVAWVVATGEHDSLVQENRDFAYLLASKGIPVHAEFWPGVFGHDWPYWRDNLRRFV
jgi:esterase/lipase superfamily enzyme